MVVIAQDELALVFDYDPLILQIDALTLASQNETQEWLWARFVDAQAMAALWRYHSNHLKNHETCRETVRVPAIPQPNHWCDQIGRGDGSG